MGFQLATFTHVLNKVSLSMLTFDYWFIGIQI